MEAQWREALRAEGRRLIGELQARRVDLGLSQAEVAARIGVSRNQISNAEIGSALLSIESLIGYAIAVRSQLTITPKST